MFTIYVLYNIPFQYAISVIPRNSHMIVQDTSHTMYKPCIHQGVSLCNRWFNVVLILSHISGRNECARGVDKYN